MLTLRAGPAPMGRAPAAGGSVPGASAAGPCKDTRQNRHCADVIDDFASLADRQQPAVAG